MALNSVNTNVGAMVALQSLQNTQEQLAVTQKQISTGYRVADSSDDGAAYAIAQGIRSTVGSLTSANQQLGNAQGLLQTTQGSLTDISNTMGSMRDVLVKLSDGSLSTGDRSNYTAQYTSMLKNIRTFIQDSNYNGKTLIDSVAGSNGSAAVPVVSINVTRNESGATYGLSTLSGSALYASIGVGTSSGSITTTQADTYLSTSPTATGSFVVAQSRVNTALNKTGDAINYVNNQITYNNDKIDALNSGLGSLVDADLAKESAQLTALQIRQQLGTQALSLANQAPQSLLSLFK
jgi:flagellin